MKIIEEVIKPKIPYIKESLIDEINLKSIIHFAFQSEKESINKLKK